MATPGSVISEYAIDALGARLTDLGLVDLGEEGSIRVAPLGEGWVRGDVSVSERKGKCFPVYSLELEVPWSGLGCTGLLALPDVCLELLDDLEVEV